MQEITKHVSYDDVVHSDTAIKLGITNVPDDNQLSRIKLLAENVYEKLFEHFNTPILIHSCFRCKKLNAAVGGATSSQHVALHGAAMDITTGNHSMVTNEELYSHILNYMDFDQLIAEDIRDDDKINWIHVSYVSPTENRKETKIMAKINNKTVYEPIP